MLSCAAPLSPQQPPTRSRKQAANHDGESALAAPAADQSLSILRPRGGFSFGRLESSPSPYSSRCRYGDGTIVKPADCVCGFCLLRRVHVAPFAASDHPGADGQPAASRMLTTLETPGSRATTVRVDQTSRPHPRESQGQRTLHSTLVESAASFIASSQCRKACTNSTFTLRRPPTCPWRPGWRRFRSTQDL